jgi:thiol-disulfide isomerase/thioredoxin
LKAAEDLTGDGKSLSTSGYESIEFLVENVNLENVDGAWLPVGGTADERYVYKGKKYHCHFAATRSNISLKPDFEKMNAFKMDLPEGNKVKDWDVPGTLFVWRNGKVQRLSEALDTLRNQHAPPLVIEQWHNSDFWQLALKDKVVLLDFWGVWCGPCRKQIPLLKRLSAKYSEQGLVVIGVHTQLKKDDIEAFILEEGISYIIGVDYEDETAQAYKVSYYPTTFLIDRQGFIRVTNPDVEELEELIISLLKSEGKVDSKEH